MEHFVNDDRHNILAELFHGSSSNGTEWLPVIFESSLPSQQHPEESTIISAFVTYANDPWDFYIIPKYRDWKMKTKGVSEAENTCWTELDILVESMSQFYESGEPETSSEWKVNQLVAVQWTPLMFIIPSEFLAATMSNLLRAKQWHRAVILEVATADDLTDEPIMKLFLIDIGKILKIPASNIAPLSPIFTDFAPMAYKCRLFGVSPVSNKWTEEAGHKFYDWTSFREAIVNVFAVNTQSKNNEDDTLGANQGILSENEQFYTVELRIKGNSPSCFILPEDNEAKSLLNNIATAPQNIFFENIADKLTKCSLGLAWNLFPERPCIFKALSGSSASVLFEHPFQSSPRLDKIKEVERKRMQIKMQHPSSMSSSVNSSQE